MNERIRQLVKQAGLKSEIMLDDSSRDVECFVTQYDGSTPSIHYWEKFAELIVRECAKVADVADENKCEWIGGNILTHFGVEE